jgi:hypothetical protein
MENGGLSAADVALLSNRDDGMWGGNSMMWIFALLILAGGGFGGFGWGNNANALGYENLATSNEVQRGFDNQNLQAQTRDILSAVNAGTAQSVAATNQVFHDIVNNVSDKYSELARDIAGVQMSVQQSIANENECCCGTKMLIAETGSGLAAQIAQNKYDNAMALAGVESRIMSKLDANKIEELQNQVNQLQLAQAVAGVVRYPMSSTYSSGCNPFCGCGCGNI